MQFDVAIVGAGPLGLSAAAELAKRGLSRVHFDKGCIARTIEWFPNQMRFYSSPEHLELSGFPLASQGEKPTREEYLAYLRAFVRYHDLKVHTYETVVSITGCKGDFQIETQRRGGATERYSAKTVVLAIGGNEFPRRLGIPGEDLPHVEHYFTDSHHYFGQTVVVVGGRNSACDAAIQLAHHGANVTLVHRQPEIDTRYLKYWIAPEMLGMLRRGVIKSWLGWSVAAIDKAGVDIRNAQDQVDRIDCDFVLLLIGYEPDFALIDQLGLETQGPQREPVINPATFESSVPGVYCCGTIIAGNQNPYRVFIENAQHHASAVADAIREQLR